jgi:TRAP-type C4-dicarboxylate transport system permease small subunit
MIRQIDRALCAFETAMVVVLTLAGLSMAFVQVVLRYLFNTGVHWLEAGLVTALVWAMLFGAVRAVREGSHPRVDLVPALMPPKVRATMNCAALTATFALVVYYLSDAVFYAKFLNMINALHPELEIRQVYPFLIIPIVTALMALRYALLAIVLWRHADTDTPEFDYRERMIDGADT